MLKLLLESEINLTLQLFDKSHFIVRIKACDLIRVSL